jgi:5'-deoxynucleotidase YfbR-like HD superfamily hydrolase
MKINKVKLKQIILEELEEVCGTQVPMQAQSPCADDHEASMAKADLHRLANYAAELEQMIQNGEELEGWVQAKITKAADYISSVKHYLEYEKMEGHE